MNRIMTAALMAAILAGCRGSSKVEQDDTIAPAGEPAWVKSALQSVPDDDVPEPVKAAPESKPVQPDPPQAEPVKSEPVNPEPGKPGGSEPVKPEPPAVQPEPPGAVSVPDIAPIIPWHLFDSTASAMRSLRPDPPQPELRIDHTPPVEPPPIEPPPIPPPAVVQTEIKPPVQTDVQAVSAPARPAPQPVDVPDADQGPRIVLDDAYVQSQAAVAASGSDASLLVFMFKGCAHCNSEAIKQAAEAEGLDHCVRVIDITKEDVRRYSLPTNESGDRLVPYYMIVKSDPDGKERVIRRFGPRRYSWEQLRSELVKHVASNPAASDAMVGAIKAGKITGGAEPVKKAIAIARELLGDNGSISVAYRKPGVSGYFETDKFGLPVRIGAQTSLGWTCSGDTLKLTINPPIKARVFPLYWVLIDHITLSADRADVSVLRGPDVYLQIE